jgi:hypothetical protein
VIYVTLIITKVSSMERLGLFFTRNGRCSDNTLKRIETSSSVHTKSAKLTEKQRNEKKSSHYGKSKRASPSRTSNQKLKQKQN